MMLRMMPMITAHFQIIPKGRRARPAIVIVRSASRRFKKQYAEGDAAAMGVTSATAWDALTTIFETLRNAEDDGSLAGLFMQRTTGIIIDGLSQAEQMAVFTTAKVDRSHVTLKDLNLRDALNKIAHYNSGTSTFRIDGRGAHYLVLCGKRGNSLWAAEILVSKLCKNAASAANAIR